jgi:hypothetical protein
MDGTGKTVVNVTGAYRWLPTFSPSGNQMVTIESGFSFTDQHLIIARFPDGKILAEIPLFAPGWEVDYGDRLGHGTIEQAIGRRSWSPGGRYLAFVGALDGPTCDLYIFDLSTTAVHRLTDGPYQPVLMGWSPDGEWIVHQSVIHFGTGAGIHGDAVWAAAVDGSEVRYLYPAKRQQSLVGWMDTRRFVAHEWGQPFGAMNILRVSLEGDEPLMVYEGPLGTGRDFGLDQGIVAFNLTSYEVQQDQQPGIYVSSILYFDEPELVLPGEWGGISYWEQESLFLAVGEHGEVVGFDGKGDQKFRLEVSGEGGWLLPSPKNSMFAVQTTQGVWLYDHEGGGLQQIMDEQIERFLWGPDGAVFFMLTEEGNMLYVGDPSNGDLAIIETGVTELGLVG